MNPNSLEIFEKKKGIFISTENIIAICWTVLTFLIFYLKRSFEFDFKGIETVILISGTIYIIGLLISTFFLYQHKVGEFKGEIEFGMDSILINQKEYLITEIENISISATDIKGNFIGYSAHFSRKLSNGLKNKITLKLKNGKEIKCNFLQTERKRIKNFKNILTSYYLKEKMSWLHLLDSLEIEDYNEIQIFKKELNKITIANTV
jgi:hypothetical protein